MRLPHEVMVFVRRAGRLLVLHRTRAYESYWHVVAGALEAAETPSDAASRELREETGLDAPDVVDLRRRFVYPLAGEPQAVRARFAPDVTQIEVSCFLAEAPPGWEPTLNDEHDRYRWCTAREAASLLYWPEPREIAAELEPL